MADGLVGVKRFVLSEPVWTSHVYGSVEDIRISGLLPTLDGFGLVKHRF